MTWRELMGRIGSAGEGPRLPLDQVWDGSALVQRDQLGRPCSRPGGRKDLSG